MPRRQSIGPGWVGQVQQRRGVRRLSRRLRVDGERVSPGHLLRGRGGRELERQPGMSAAPRASSTQKNNSRSESVGQKDRVERMQFSSAAAVLAVNQQSLPDGGLDWRIGAIHSIKLVLIRFGQREWGLSHEPRDRAPVPLGRMNKERVA